MSEEKVPYGNDPFENMTGDEFIEALNTKNWKEVQRLHTSTFEALLQDGRLTLLFPDGQRKQFERSDVEALTHFLDQYAGVSPLTTSTDDPFEGFEPIKVELAPIDVVAPDQEPGEESEGQELNQRTQQIIEGLLEIATPGAVKNSLWQVYQEILHAEQQSGKSIESFLATLPKGIQEHTRWWRNWEDGLLYPSTAIRYWKETASLTDDGRAISSSGSQWAVAAWVSGRSWIGTVLSRETKHHYETWSLHAFESSLGPHIIDYDPPLEQNLHGKQGRYTDIVEQDVRDFARAYIIDYYGLHPSNHQYIEILHCGHHNNHHANWECKVNFSASSDMVNLLIEPTSRGLEVFAHRYED